MKKTSRLLFVLLVGMVFSLQSALVFSEPATQVKYELWCNDTYDANHALAWDKIGPSVTPLVEDFKFDAAYKFIESKIKELLTTEDQDRPEIKTFLKYLETTRTGDSKVHWQFNNSNVDTAKLFFGTADEIKYDCNQLPPATFKIVLGYAAGAMHHTHRTILEPSRQAVAKKITELSKNYEKFLFNGLPMWPWEAWLNGLFLPEEDSVKAPLRQFTFFRPSAGFEINTDSRAESSIEPILAIEPLGYVWYKDREYDSWQGISLLTTFRTDMGAGLGLMYRYNNYTIGVSKHTETDDDYFLYVGIELYQFLSEKNEGGKLLKEKAIKKLTGKN